jgi:hypothetical protein
MKADQKKTVGPGHDIFMEPNDEKLSGDTLTSSYMSEHRMQLFDEQGIPPKKDLLTDQARRSSRSVCGNIAEAWRKRRPAAFVAS